MHGVFFGLLLTFSFSTALADLSKFAETSIRNKLGEVQKAQAALVERTLEFNTEEAHLRSLSYKNKSDLDKALVLLYGRKKFERATWEKFFPSGEGKTLQDEIEVYHRDVIASNHASAVKASKDLGISLSLLRQDVPKTQKFCAAFPKGGILHTHPYGTMERATVRVLLDVLNPIIRRSTFEKYIGGKVESIHRKEAQFLDGHGGYYDTPRSWTEIAARYPQDAEKIMDFFFVPRNPEFFEDGVTPFSRFLAAFVIPLELFGIFNSADNQILLEKIIYNDMFLRNITQNVGYMEITRNVPPLTSSRKFSDRYNELLRQTEGVQGIAPRTLLSVMRTGLTSDEQRVRQVSTITDLLSMGASQYVVGVNLMGDESLVDALDASQFVYGKLLAENRVRDTGLQATIHAGELGDVRNLRDALAFGVRRIGHGILLKDNPLYLELVRRTGVALEISLSSNEILHVSPVSSNPFLYFQRLGVPVSLSTDDEGIFLTDPNRECVLAILQTDIEYSELRQMAVNSIGTSFADSALKALLLEKLDTDLKMFEKTWKNLP